MFNYKNNKVKYLIVSIIVFSIFSYLTFTLFLNYKMKTSINNSDKIVVHVVTTYFDDNGEMQIKQQKSILQIKIKKSNYLNNA